MAVLKQNKINSNHGVCALICLYYSQYKRRVGSITPQISDEISNFLKNVTTFRAHHEEIWHTDPYHDD